MAIQQFNWQKRLPKNTSTILALISSLLCILSVSAYGNSQSTLEETQTELNELRLQYNQLQTEFDTFEKTNAEYIQVGKEIIQRQEKQLQEASQLVERLEKEKKTDLIQAALAAINLLPTSDQKDALTQRVEKAKKQIELDAKLTEATAAVGQLETEKTREQLQITQQIVAGLPDSNEKKKLTDRVTAAQQVIEQNEAQAAKEREVAERAATQQAEQSSQQAATTVYYKNCRAVRAAGAAPLYRGEPGYAPHLDRDGDGIACE